MHRLGGDEVKGRVLEEGGFEDSLPHRMRALLRMLYRLR